VWKADVISADWLTKQKDALSALNSIVTMLILVAGSIFSYYRFFRGRTLSLRSELSLEVSVHETSEQHLIHAIALTAKNVGGSTIWNPKPRIIMHIHGPKDVEQHRVITNWWEGSGNEDQKTAIVIDPAETVGFFAQQNIPDKAWAVTYMVSLQADRGDVWSICKTVSNKSDA